MSIFSIGDAQYDIDDLKIAKRLTNGNYGPLVDVPSVNMFSVEHQMRSAEARGDGRITAVASALESAMVTFRSVSFSQAVFEILMGYSSYLSGTAPNRKQSIKFGVGRAMPWFGIVARSLSSQDTSCTLVFLPYVKLYEGFTYSLNDNEFASPEIRCRALGDPYLTDDAGRPLLIQSQEYETIVSIAMPLP
jgi:hypothetical protein